MLLLAHEHRTYASVVYLLTRIALSSMMHPDPITMGPAIANIVALGCTMVPKKLHFDDLCSRVGRVPTRPNSNVSFQFHILTYDSFGVNCKFIASRKNISNISRRDQEECNTLVAFLSSWR